MRQLRRVHSITRVHQDLLLLHGDLEDAAQRPVVAMDRRRGQAEGQLVVQPILDLVGRQVADAVGAEAGTYLSRSRR
jgi:hypothetical protein